MLPRLIEFLFFLFILYLFFRRLGTPFLRGYDARERERQQERQNARVRQTSPADASKPSSRIDRSQVEDADFKDLD